MYHKLIDREWLEVEYVDKLRTLQSIADEVGCNKATVGRALKRLGLKRRKRTSRYKLINDKEWLRVEYLDNKRSIADLSREIGCTVGPVRDALRAMGIQTRNNIEARRLYDEQRTHTGHLASNWRGGRSKTGGYIKIYNPDHPYATKQGYVMEHRLLMEKHLGRYLKPGEIVHHLDGNKQNNTIENLELTRNGRHIHDHFMNSHKVIVLRQRVAELEAEVERLKEEIDR